MPTSFTVFSLGRLPVWDPAEGNTTLSTQAVNNSLGTYGSIGDPLFDSRQEFAPAGNGFSGGGDSSYDLDNNVSNDQFSINGGPLQSHDATLLFNATITYTDGTTADISAVLFQDAAGNTYWAPEVAQNSDQAAIDAKPIQSLELRSPIYANGNNGEGYGLTANRADSMPICFSKGSLIKCLDGEIAVENLTIGDLVLTRDHGPQAIRWIGHRKFVHSELEANPKIRPVRISKDALAPGCPKRDLVVSPQHRILVQSVIAKRMFGEEEVLVAANKLVGWPAIFVDDDIEGVEYYHLLFDQHELVYADDCLTESLFTGPEALKSVDKMAQEEILGVFPELSDLVYKRSPVRRIPPNSKQKELLKRHLKNGRTLVSSNQP